MLPGMLIAQPASACLLCRVNERWCALQRGDVIETMRMLPVVPLAGAPAYVLGVALIRGASTPVVDAGRLLFPVGEDETSEEPPTRLVTVRSGGHVVALAVSELAGIRALDKDSLATMPPLVREASAIESIEVLDSRLLLVLRAGRLLPEGFALPALDESA
jgi:purine-binding chemotaxis protein CheW